MAILDKNMPYHLHVFNVSQLAVYFSEVITTCQIEICMLLFAGNYYLSN